MARFLEAGVAAYAIEPAGQQTIVSQLTAKTAAAPAPTGAPTGKTSGRSGHQGVFETTHVAVGTADLVRDHGVSLWGSVHPTKVLTLQVAYTRSIHYALNTVSFGIGVNLGSVLRNMRSYD